MVITPPSGTQPDLVVQSPSVSGFDGTSGDSFTLNATVRNQGTGAAATTLRYYRSSDATISTGDTAAGTDAVGALAASATSAESISLTAPATAGTYYYGACVDTVTRESDTANNCSSAVRVTVSSSGGGNNFGVGDALLGVPTSGFFVPARVSGASVSSSGGTTTLTFNNGGFIELQDGTRYTCRTAGGCAASNGVVTLGTIERGGGGTTTPTTQADLVVQTPSTSGFDGTPGDSFTLNATVRNSGIGAAAATTLRYYRSSDATIATTDTAVGTDAVGALAASATSAESISLTAPATAGTYYYGACVDTVTDEANTGNNCSTGVTVVVTAPVTPPDLVVESPGVSDATPTTGGSFTLNATVRNQGTGAATATTLRYYRSSDATISTGDTAAGTDAVGALAASATSAESISLTAPATAGTYYYGACVDTVTRESDTANNCSSAVRVTVSSSGGGNNFGVGDALLGVPTSGFFVPARVSGASVSSSGGTTTLTFNNGGFIELQDGTRYTCRTAGGCAASNGVVTLGTIERGGGGTTTPTTQADLVVQTPSTSGFDGTPGDSFTLNATVRNSGIGAAAATTLRYYRSSDATIATTDTAVGTDAVGALAASATSAESISLTAPATAGTYYYGACVDTVTDEANTGNNCSTGVTVVVTAPVTPPDLVVESPGVSDATPTTGGSFTLNATVRNQGTGAATATTLRYYRSSDATISTGDTAAGTDAVGALAASATSAESISLTAPATAGTYYYGACVDTVTDEANTGNNCSTGVTVVVTAPVTPPDLVVESPGVSDATPTTGGSFTLNATVRNQGTGAAAATTLRYYRSTDATISTADTAAGTDRVSGLAASGTSDESISLPAPATAGTYYYGACVDTVSGEADTGNNCSTGVTVAVAVPTPDLVVASPTVSDGTPTTGGSFTLSATVRNAGTGAAVATTLRYYRSSDATVTTSDTAVGTDAVSGLTEARPGSSDVSYESISLTAPATAGTYYYGACVDSVSGESDTGNNCSTGVEVVVADPVAAPDLVVESPTVSNSSPSAGASFTLSATVHNQGGDRSAATTLRYYRSSDATITTSDTQVDTDFVSGLAAGATSDESIRLTAPATAGTYYYGACVDTVTGEADTTNNCSTGVAVAVPVPTPDLVVAPPTVSNGTPPTGGSFTLSATVRNQGTALAAATTLRYYRSTDTTISTADTEVGTDAVSGLTEARPGPSDVSYESISLTAPATVGTYYYGACVDSVTGESDTGNNCSTGVTVAVAARAPDLVVDASASDTSLDLGGSFTLRARVRNQGTGATPATTLRYYRSTDTTISTADTEVGTDAVHGLAASATSNESITLTAPATVGTYYYGACVDTVTDEADTTNNCSTGVTVVVAPAPDLVVESPTVSNSSPSAGASFTLSATVHNQGTGAAVATTLRYYRSTNATISTSDTAVGTDSVSGLAASATSDESISLTAPETAGTTYYYGACVDTVSGESDTGNNCSTGVTVTVPGSDLVVESPTVSNSSPSAGASFTLSATVRNQGSNPSAATTLRYYRSTNATISTSDSAVGTDSVSGLAAGATSAESISLTAPSSFGTYYYGACVDTVSGESDTGNNCSHGVRVTHDRLSAVTGLSVTQVGFSRNLRWTWNAVSGATHYKLYYCSFPTSGFCENFPPSLLVEVTGTTYFHENALFPGGTTYYTFRISPCSSLGCR